MEEESSGLQTPLVLQPVLAPNALPLSLSTVELVIAPNAKPSSMKVVVAVEPTLELLHPTAVLWSQLVLSLNGKTYASLSRTSILAQYLSHTLPLNLRSPTPEETTQEVPKEEEDYEMPQYEVEEGEEDDEEENEEEEDEDEVDAPVLEDQDFDQLLDNLLQLPGREQLVCLSVDPIPNVKSIW